MSAGYVLCDETKPIHEGRYVIAPGPTLGDITNGLSRNQLEHLADMLAKSLYVRDQGVDSVLYLANAVREDYK